ncbi:hypothetical protein ROA7450_02677 [Roseovarius albus]|uniref:Uncharacterized protein n=1 Tax=Roseovarius albus TaxID=1247867 RepID=A0A1X6ZJI2_9RHOB|nr:hypothetical protein ROA7450_02677 [Roseovarius albus]
MIHQRAISILLLVASYSILACGVRWPRLSSPTKNGFQALHFPIWRSHLRRDAFDLGHMRKIEVGGNGATIETEDPEGRERFQLGNEDV